MKYAFFSASLLGLTLALVACSDTSTGNIPATCGNGVVDPGETCDPTSSCPTSCNDNNACTSDQLTGSVEACSAACTYTTITTCIAGDGCCPAGCTALSDSDCSTTPGGSGGAAGGAGGNPGTSGGNGNGGTPNGTGGSAMLDCDEGTIESSPNSLAVDVTAADQVIHKEIFGVLLETLGRNVNGGVYVGTNSPIANTQGVRNDIIDAFKEAGVGAVQWPGGCAANNYNWRTNVRPSNTMGTDLFMEFSKWIEAEPFLVGRPQAEHAQSNRDWVEYVNNNPEHPDWQLKYFKVGNEVWGCGGELDTNYSAYEPWYNANYELLRPPVNGKNLILVAGTGGIWTINASPTSENWLNVMLSPGHIADKLDGIEIHDYIYFPDSIPAVGFTDAQYYDIVNRANEGQIAPRIRDIKTILNRHDPSGRIKIIEDEWGNWLDGDDPQDTWFQKGTLMDAISAAEHLHVFMEHADRILMAGLAQSTNVIHSLFATNSTRGGTDLVKTPTFYVFKMFVPHHIKNAQWAPIDLESQMINGGGRNMPVLSTGATVNEDGEVHLSIANVDLVESRSLTTTFASDKLGYVVESAEIITGAAKDTFNDFGQAERINIKPFAEDGYDICGKKLKVEVPAKSIVMLKLKPL